MSTLLRCSDRGNSGIRSKQSLERKDMEWKNVAMLSSPCVCCVTPLSSIWSVKSRRVFDPTPEKEMVSSLLLILCGVIPAYVHSGMHNHIVCICCAFLHCVLQLEAAWCVVSSLPPYTPSGMRFFCFPELGDAAKMTTRATFPKQTRCVS